MDIINSIEILVTALGEIMIRYVFYGGLSYFIFEGLVLVRTYRSKRFNLSLKKIGPWLMLAILAIFSLIVIQIILAYDILTYRKVIDFFDITTLITLIGPSLLIVTPIFLSFNVSLDDIIVNENKNVVDIDEKNRIGTTEDPIERFLSKITLERIGSREGCYSWSLYTTYAALGFVNFKRKSFYYRLRLIFLYSFGLSVIVLGALLLFSY